MASFAVAFSTTKKGEDLLRSLIQGIFGPQNEIVVLRSTSSGENGHGMVHIILSRLGTTIISIANTCPIRAVQQLIAVGEFVGWEMKKGLPFLQYSDGSKACQAGARFTPTFSKPISLLPQSAVEAGFARRFLHALGGGAVSRASAGDDCVHHYATRVSENPPKLLGDTCTWLKWYHQIHPGILWFQDQRRHSTGQPKSPR